MGEQIRGAGDAVKLITSKRPSNYFGPFGLIRPGESVVVADEQAAGLSAEEFDVSEALDSSPFDIPLTDPETPPTVVTKPARKGKTR